MSNTLSPLQHVEHIRLPEIGQPPATGSEPGTFRSMLDSAIAHVDGAQQDASRAVESFLNGTGPELHETILATQRADLQLQLFLQLRNKAISAYQELMRTQV